MKKFLQWGLAVGVVFFIFVLATAYWMYLSYDRALSKEDSFVSIVVREGEDTVSVAKDLKRQKLIGSVWGFIWGLEREGLFGKLQAGTYEVSSSLTPRELAVLLTEGEAASKEIVITFPEGWAVSKMAERLTANNLPGEEFLEIAQSPPSDLLSAYPFLSDLPEGASLEGYLFPDTYHFFRDVTAREIVEKMLDDFEARTSALYEEVKKRGENFHETVTLASIIESEVRSSADRRVVSGIFQSRLRIDMPLQSDATLSYILSSGKTKHSAEELETDSPYNTYKYPGLPPGPVSNPSLDALEAAVYPEDSNYLYFLSDPNTGETYFSVTFDEHKANKVKVGL